MPWHIEKDGDRFCVIKDDDGSKAGCHPTKDEATAQMRALYANEKGSAWEMAMGFLLEQARKFSAEQRKKAADDGAARSDGSFPIKNEQDLKNAIKAFGRAKNKAAAKRHIIKRAKALGKTSLLPEGWK